MSRDPDVPSSRKVSVSMIAPFPKDLVFSIITNPAEHKNFDGSGTVKDLVDGARITGIGDVFRIKMRMWGISYRIKNTVMEYSEGVVVAWAHLGKHRWRYELEEVNGGTLITETFDWSYSVFPWLIEFVGYPESHPPRMERSLKALIHFLEEQ